MPQNSENEHQKPLPTIKPDFAVSVVFQPVSGIIPYPETNYKRKIMTQTQTIRHVSFPSIEQFRNVIRNVTHRSTYKGQDQNDQPIYQASVLPVLKYRGTVKLHGSNAGILITKDGQKSYQSRENILSLTQDNAGFCLFASNLPDGVTGAFTKLFLDTDDKAVALVIFGEWCGGNIQKGVTINGLPKMFVVFAVRKLYTLERDSDNEFPPVWVKPELWSGISFHDHKVFNIHEFPTFELDIDFNKPELAQNELIKLTEDVERECPVGKSFGNSGIGEGVVWTPVDEDWSNSGYWMKVKGEKHQSSKVKTLAPIDVEKVEGIRNFVDNVLTESRLNQGIDKLREAGLPLERKSLGDFLRWIVNDVVKEETDTIVANQLDPKLINSEVSKKARLWFFDNEINFK